jgi:hypothetical protein
MGLTRREVWVAGLIAASAGFVFVGYSAIRNASSTLFKQAYGAEKLPVVIAVMPLGVLALLFAYARLLSGLGPRRTLLVTSVGSGVFIGACYAAIRLEYLWPGLRIARAVVRIFSDGYIALLVEQYWSLINSTFDDSAAKKLNGPIMGLASLGAIAGGLLVGATVMDWGTANMLLIAAISVIPAAVLSDRAYGIAGEPKERRRHDGGRASDGWGLLFRSPLMISILAMIVTTQVVIAAVELNYQTVLQGAIPQADRQTQWAGRLEAVMNASAAFMQFVAAPLLLRWLPVGAILVAMPVIQLGVSVGGLRRPSLYGAAGAYLVFKMFDYSLFKAAKEILYIPLSFDARYRVKELIDVLGYRTAKGATSAVLAVAERAGVMLASVYGPVAVAGALVWGVAAVAVARASRGVREGTDPAAATANFSGDASDSAATVR